MTSRGSIVTTLLLVGVISATYRQSLIQNPYPACPPTIEQFMTAYAHPLDCKKFLYCMFGNLVEFQCPGKMHFDGHTNKCTHPSVANCPQIPTRSSTPSTVTDEVITSETPFPKNVSEITKDVIITKGTTTPYRKGTTIGTTTVVHDNCGSTVSYTNATSGYVFSPYYPNNYKNNMDCYNNITASNSTFLEFRVVHLDLENQYDFVEFVDGSKDRISMSTGTGTNPEVFTNTNFVSVHFHSDSTVVRSGFNISFTSSACSGPRNYSDTSGSIASPGYPKSPYSNNLDCFYNINTPAKSKVVIHIDHFDVENDNTPGLCPNDYLQIYDGPTSNYLTIATLCGTSLPTYDYYSSTNRVLLHFHTNNATTGSGFNMTFTSTE